MNPPRPKISDKDIVYAAACKLAENIVKYYPEYGPIDNELLTQLQDAIKFDNDGYDIARSLDRDGWSDMCAGMVEILDNAYHFKYSELKEAEKKWVIINSLTSPVSIGDNVETINYHVKTYGVVTEIINTGHAIIKPSDQVNRLVHIPWENLKKKE